MTGRPRSRLRPADLLPVATLGLRARPVRALLSAVGVAIGIASVVAVLGITRSSQADLLAQIDQLGTDLLTVANGQDFGGRAATLPATAPAMLGRVDGVRHVAPTATLPALTVYRTDVVPRYLTNALAVRACDTGLLSTVDGTVLDGRFLTAATARYPAAVLGFQAARALGVTTVTDDPRRPGRIWLGGHWFTVTGILGPLPLAPEIDRSVLIGFPVAVRMFGYDGHPNRIYLRTDPARTSEVAGVLAGTADPEHPNEVAASRPSDTLTARLRVAGAATSLFLGLGAVALLVGGIGIANVMVISVLERRSEIGLRRALGARRGHVAVQFLTESLLLSAAGGLLGVAAGTGITGTVARLRHWTLLVPPVAALGGLAAAVAIGALAGLYPATRAARLAPTDALRTS